MKELILVALGAAVTVIAFLLTKSFGSKTVAPAVDTPETIEAIEKASELMGQRVVAETSSEEVRTRVEAKLNIPDPRKRLEAIAAELKDL